jgi:hypothetical protein
LDINNAWENIRENIKIPAKENLRHYKLKRNKQSFDDECSKLIDQRKQAKLQWLQNRSEINGDNLQNLRGDTRRKFRKNIKEIRKTKLMSLKLIIKTKRFIQRRKYV